MKEMESLFDLFDAAAQEPETVEKEVVPAEPVAEEPEPVAVEPEPVVEEPEPVVEEQEPVVEESEPAVEAQPVAGEPAPKSDKLYYTIGEVARQLGEATSLVRFWADSFPKIVKPKRTMNKNNRLFRQSDVEALQRIHYLVKECGLTLDGARRRMETGGDSIDNRVEAVKRLKAVRGMLKEIHDRL